MPLQPLILYIKYSCERENMNNEFKIRDVVLFNPCNKCLVRAACSSLCQKYYNYKDNKLIVTIFIVIFLMTTGILSLAYAMTLITNQMIIFPLLVVGSLLISFGIAGFVLKRHKE